MTTYDVMDRVRKVVTSGPAMSGAPAQAATVVTEYDREGEPLVISRSQAPNPANLNVLTTRREYDYAGRIVLEVAPDLMRDSIVYDRAGNVVIRINRRGLADTMAYDAMNRLLTRTRPSVSYARRTDGVTGKRGSAFFLLAFPRYPNDAAGGYTIARDVARFSYDSAGRLIQADNADARVARTYFRNGAINSETLRVRTVADTTSGGGFGSHVYTIQYGYDKDGRRTSVAHPAQLAAGSALPMTDRYSYDPVTGELTGVTDARGNASRMSYTARGELLTLTRPGQVVETRGYDADGNLKSFWMTSASIAYGRHPDTTVRSTTLSYDPQGLILSASDPNGYKDNYAATYTGLGRLASSQYRQQLRYFQVGTAFSSSEVQSYDPLGNIQSSVSATRFSSSVYGTSDSSSKAYTYDALTGRLTSGNVAGGAQRFTYDASGNTVWASRDESVAQGPLEDRISYYDAGDVLRAADYRRIENGQAPASPTRYTFEEYRYDALGRRVWVWARRGCTDVPQGESAECAESFLRRVVWDGSAILDEVQVPGDSALPAASLEDDLSPVGFALNAQYDDPNPYYGITLYTNAASGVMGIDMPLSATRVNYVDAPSGWPRKLWAPFSVYPVWNARGQPDDGIVADSTPEQDGGRWLCTSECTVGQYTGRMVKPEWPLGWYGYLRPRFVQRNWLGSLLEDQQDKGGGTLYRRNRYYDPATGRFTQEDPIGLPGGMNLYGFAGGDPVNYSDPFGLKVCFLGKGASALANATMSGTGTTFDLDGAGCAVNVQAVGGKWSEVSTGFAELAADDGFLVNVQYGTGGSRTDENGITVDKRNFGKAYGTSPASPGVCNTSPGATWTEPSVVTHEMGHAYGTFAGQSPTDNNETAVRWENTVHSASGRPMRSQQCHVK